MNNYRVQNACGNCKFCVVDEISGREKFFCDKDNSFIPPDNCVTDEDYKKYLAWCNKHYVEKHGVCDLHVRAYEPKESATIRFALRLAEDCKEVK